MTTSAPTDRPNLMDLGKDTEESGCCVECTCGGSDSQ
jgi:hypothetical protein